MLQRFIDFLPPYLRWTIHNLIGHPLSEVVHLLGFTEFGNRIHDGTLPTDTTYGRG